MMNTQASEFARLLTEGIYAIKLIEDRPIGIIQDELGYALGRDSGGSAIAHWRRGYIPGQSADLENLAREMVRRGALTRGWLEQLFTYAGYPYAALSTELFTDQTAVQTTNMRLPGKDYRHLVGRDDLIAQVLAVLHDPTGQAVVSVDGQGGIGKTALARDVVARAIADGEFETAVWISAARRTGMVPGHALTFNRILEQIGDQLGVSDIAERSEQQKEAVIHQLLTEQRVLITLDNLETAADMQADIVTRLSPLLGNSKALLTSRHRFRQHTYAVHLTGLLLAGAVALIQQHAAANGFHHVQAADPADLKAIASATGGSPLAIKLVVSQLNHLPVQVVLQNLREVTPLTNIADEGEYVRFYKFVFFRSWDLLTHDNKKLLVTMTQFMPANGAHFEALQQVSAMPFRSLLDSIEQLWGSSLLEVRTLSGIGQMRYYLHPLTQNFVISDIARISHHKQRAEGLSS